MHMYIYTGLNKDKISYIEQRERKVIINGKKKVYLRSLMRKKKL